MHLFLVVAARVIWKVIVVSEKFGIVLYGYLLFSILFYNVFVTQFYPIRFTLAQYVKLDLPEPLIFPIFFLAGQLFSGTHWQLFDSLPYRQSWLLFAFCFTC